MTLIISLAFILEFRSYFSELLTDGLERLKHTGFADDILTVPLEPLRGTFKGQALDLDQHMDVLECLDIFLLEETVSFGISFRLDEFRELIGPETHQRGAFTQNLGDFTDGVQILFHINPLIVR